MARNTVVAEGINMLSHRLAIGLLIAQGLLASAFSQDVPLTPEQAKERARIEALLRSSYIPINGKETPELVPYHVRMAHFFDGMKSGRFREHLDPLLSAADLAKLNEYAARHGDVERRHAEAYEAAWMKIAARAQDMSAIEIASAVKTATDTTHQALSAEFRAVISSLSAEGQAVVNDFAFKRIRPQLSIEDPFVVARADPEFYKIQFIRGYELMRSGNYPPTPQIPKAQAAPEASSQAQTLTTEQGKLGKTPSQ